MFTTKMNIAICIPSHSIWMAEFGFCLSALMLHSMTKQMEGVGALKLMPFNVRGSQLSQNREMLAMKALEYKCDYILWLDSDMKFPKETLHRLVGHEKDFVAVNGTTKAIPSQPVAQHMDGSIMYSDPEDSGLEPCRQVGLAVALMKTELLTRVEHPWFPQEWIPEKHAYAGEDVYFCHQLRAQGIELLIDHDLSKKVFHIGHFAFGHDVVGDIADGRSSAA